MEVFTWRAEVGTSQSGEFRMLTSKFGDGYSQESPDGINNETQTWSVVVSGRPALVDPVLAFIRARKGQVFQWKPPGASALEYYRCKRYSKNDQGAAYSTLTMEFEQGYV